MKYTENDIRKYVEKCFRDAFKTEGRNYNREDWNFEYVLIKKSNDIVIMCPIIRCKYYRILRKVDYRLAQNLMKNFGIAYKETDNTVCHFYNNGQIDFNYTLAMFQYKNENWALNIEDYSNPVNKKSGECMPAYTYEKLLFKYWNITPEIYRTLSFSDEKNSLPHIFHWDWEAYKELYRNTFEKEIGADYEFNCSNGIKRI